MNTDENQRGTYAKVNGLDLYYEIHGSGQPLALLPGGFMTMEAMGELVPQLAAARRIIGVELQGHGHTADIERPLRFEFMADDIAALIGHLGLEQADIFGFSLGGGVALQTAIRHPEVVRKQALASTPFKRAACASRTRWSSLLCLGAAKRTATWPVSRLLNSRCSRPRRMQAGTRHIMASSRAPNCSSRSSQNFSIHLCQRPAEVEERCA